MPNVADDLIALGNARLNKIEAAGIRKFNDQISQIPGIIKLTLGEPDLNTAQHIKDAAIQSINNDLSHYTPAKGITELRQAIANFFKQTQSLDYDPESEVIATVGSTEGLTASLMALLNPNDEVIVISPAYPLYPAVLKLIGAHPIIIDTSNTNFELKIQSLKQTIKKHPNAKAIILNYPNNPTGKEYFAKNLKEIAQFAQQNHLLVFSDEIYSELVYHTPHVSIARYIPERTIIFNGISKSFAMTGYRIGSITGPQALIEKIAKIHSYLVTCPTNSSQYAAVEAFNQGRGDIEEAKAKYQKRRNLLIAAFDRLGLEYTVPDGAFYLFASIPKSYGNDDYQFALDLAQKAHVGVIPGRIFGIGGRGKIRLSYAASLEQLQESINRIDHFLNNQN